MALFCLTVSAKNTEFTEEEKCVLSCHLHFGSSAASGVLSLHLLVPKVCTISAPLIFSSYGNSKMGFVHQKSETVA